MGRVVARCKLSKDKLIGKAFRLNGWIPSDVPPSLPRLICDTYKPDDRGLISLHSIPKSNYVMKPPDKDCLGDQWRIDQFICVTSQVELD